MSDIITLPRVVALHFREALICGKGRSPHRCHDCDFHLDEAALDALDAALAEPDATREPATHEQAVAAYDGKKGTHKWVDFRDGWQAAEHFHGIRGKQEMTRDEIAQAMQDSAGYEWGNEAHFQRFAALIAAQRDADKSNQPYSYDGLVMFPPGTLAELIRRERAKEREACAEVCDKLWSAAECAEAIRARGEK